MSVYLLDLDKRFLPENVNTWHDMTHVNSSQKSKFLLIKITICENLNNKCVIEIICMTLQIIIKLVINHCLKFKFQKHKGHTAHKSTQAIFAQQYENFSFRATISFKRFINFNSISLASSAIKICLQDNFYNHTYPSAVNLWFILVKPRLDIRFFIRNMCIFLDVAL